MQTVTISLIDQALLPQAINTSTSFIAQNSPIDLIHCDLEISDQLALSPIIEDAYTFRPCAKAFYSKYLGLILQTSKINTKLIVSTL